MLVLDKTQKSVVAQFFKTPLVFTIQEAKGLEYENIILVNFISDYEKEFREISSGVTPEDRGTRICAFPAPKTKSNKEQEAYKFYINSLYVAFTRAVKNLYIVEKTKKHDLLRLLQVVEPTQKVTIAQQDSDETEWLEEARRLELQGKTEQAEAIRARLRGEEYISTDEAELLAEKIFDSATQHSSDDLGRLFRFARSRYRLDLIRRLNLETKYGPAKQHLGEYEKAQRELLPNVRNGNKKNLDRIFTRFGVNISEPAEGMTALMLAIQFGKDSLTEALLEEGANVNNTDRLNRTALQHLLLGYDRRQVKLHLLTKWYPRLSPAAARNRYGDRLYIISRKSMEYFLLNLINALRADVYGPEDPLTKQCLLMDDFMEIISEMPPAVLADYRRRRQYVNGILAKNERDRDDPYNKKLFLRRSRGCYDLLPESEVSWG